MTYAKGYYLVNFHAYSLTACFEWDWMYHCSATSVFPMCEANTVVLIYNYIKYLIL